MIKLDLMHLYLIEYKNSPCFKHRQFCLWLHKLKWCKVLIYGINSNCYYLTTILWLGKTLKNLLMLVINVIYKFLCNFVIYSFNICSNTTNIGNSLAVKLLGFFSFHCWGWDQFLAGELRAHKPLGAAKKKKKNQPNNNLPH